MFEEEKRLNSQFLIRQNVVAGQINARIAVVEIFESGAGSLTDRFTIVVLSHCVGERALVERKTVAVADAHLLSDSQRVTV